jgi:hypothetical protein
MSQRKIVKLVRAIERLTGPVPPIITPLEAQKRLERIVDRPVRCGDVVLTLRQQEDCFWVESTTVS